MKSILIKFFIDISSFSWVIFLYFLNNNIFIFKTTVICKLISVGVYVFICSFLSYISLVMLNYFVKRTKQTFKVEKIYPIYSDGMPVYLSICVIAFELNDYINFNESFTVIFALVFIFIIFLMSNIGYLNPFWFGMGKRIYKVENQQGNYIVVLGKGDISKGITSLDSLVKFNEYILIKMKKEN